MVGSEWAGAKSATSCDATDLVAASESNGAETWFTVDSHAIASYTKDNDQDSVNGSEI
jgi:hypothetical protein